MRMKLFVLLGVFLVCGASFDVTKMPKKALGYVRLPIRAQVAQIEPETLRAAALSRRQVLSTQLTNQFYYYTADIDVGTPPQRLQVQVDTGSSDLWVMLSTNPFCNGTIDEIQKGLMPDCNAPIVYQANSSSSFENTTTPFDIRYGDYSYAKGFWARDTIAIAGAEITSSMFATAQESNSTLIVMGIGLDQNEAYTQRVVNGRMEPRYPNIPQLMKQQGHIQSNSYSLWLNDQDSLSGSLMFGALDHAKYAGELAKVPMINTSKNLSDPFGTFVMLNGISSFDGRATTQQLVEAAFPALLDSGTSLIYLPEPMVRVMARAINYTYDDESAFYIGPCATVTGDDIGSFRFNLSGIEIDVPYGQLTAQLFVSDRQTCALLVQHAPHKFATILGDAFLRSVYAVFDLDNFEIAMAQAKFDVIDEQIEVIHSTIPSATKAAMYSGTKINPTITTLGAGAEGTTAIPAFTEPTFTTIEKKNKKGGRSRQTSSGHHRVRDPSHLPPLRHH